VNNVKKNDIFTDIVDRFDGEGQGIVIHEGMVVFVPFSLPTEEIEYKILKVDKKCAYGKLIKIIKESPFRIKPVCPVFTKCGGCDLQHIDYKNQLILKTSFVDNLLNRLGKLNVNVSDCIASENILNCRNKMQLPISMENGKLNIGFYYKNSHRIVDIDKCFLYGDWNETLISLTRKFLLNYNISIYDEETKQGLVKHLVARFIDEHLMLTIVINGDKLPFYQEFIDILLKKFNNLSFFININKMNNNVILSDKFICLYGDKEQVITTFDILHKVSPYSFLQVNDYIQNCIYQKIFDNCDKEDVIIDAYSGAGLLTAILSKKCKKCYGIEIIKDATIDADNLAKDNNLSFTNINGDCAIELPRLINNLVNEKITLVVDPPRKGCDVKVLDSIINCNVYKMFYISCNPATLSRDIAYLFKDEKFKLNYKISLVQPFDMFPQTCHVETLVIIENVSSKKN
jgi:23S rRNA (uracil1939-C5)-methyltransferase